MVSTATSMAAILISCCSFLNLEEGELSSVMGGLVSFWYSRSLGCAVFVVSDKVFEGIYEG